MVETLGFNQTITLVLTCPPYLIAGAVTIAVSWSSGKFNERTWHITISKAVATIGFVAAAATLNLAGRYVAMVVFTIGTYGVNSLILGWCGSVCGQTKEKKSAAIAIVTTIMNISFICKFFPSIFLAAQRTSLPLIRCSAIIHYWLLFNADMDVSLLVGTPYLWPSSDEPRYAIAMGSSAGFSLATAALAWVAKIIMMRRNKKLRQSDDETRVFYVH